MFEALVEQRILEAQTRGEFDRLPGAGRPMDLDEDPLVPGDLRVAWRVLKNAGFVPPEVEALRQVRDAAVELDRATDGAAKDRALRRLQALSLALAESRPGRQRGLFVEPDYHARIVSKLA
jgi:hypothetical protein